MTFEFNYSKQTEIDRLIFTYGSIVKGIYQKLGFLLLTENPNEEKTPTVIIPEIIRNLPNEITDELEKTDICVGVFTDNQTLQKYFNSEFENIKLIRDERIEDLKREWKKLERKVKIIIDAIFPDNSFTKVNIIPSLYGTVGSYHSKKNEIFITLRIDQPVSYIVAMLIRAIVHYTGLEIKNENETYLNTNMIWDKKEEFTDMLMQFSALKFLCPMYKSTLEILSTPELDEKLIVESRSLYSDVGFPVEKSLRLNGFVVKLYGKNLETLTKTQNNLLIRLLKTEEQTVSNEEIAQIMWGENYHNKYSLSAMAKMIHQLREKLKSAGLQKEVIFTKRGKGYVLVQ